MTRINVVHVRALTDQHLMAEYRELPMVMAAASRSKPENYTPSTKYTLNKGHVKFFYNKKSYLQFRWNSLIEELKIRGYNIDPDSRSVDFSILDKFPQVEWEPDDDDRTVNHFRLMERINERPEWYRYYGRKLLAGIENSC